ncbi:MDR/zinc-dependent alcohol dehydrogenase-like family protein [Streptomyces asiaticus]
MDIELAGLCRSDLKEVAGLRHGPSQFGHELVGTVGASAVPGLAEGTRVVLDPNVMVQRGTGFADRMWAAGPVGLLRRALQPVPHGALARRMVFAEPLACAQHCLRVIEQRVGSLAGARMSVLGAGTAGVLIAMLAHLAGARVTLGNRGRRRIDAVRRTQLLDAPVAPFDWLPTSSADIVLIATSFILPNVMDEALRVLAPGGLLMLYGGTSPGDRHPGLECDLDGVRRSESVAVCHWKGRPLRVAGSYGTTEEDFAAAIGVLTDPWTPLRAETLVASEVALPRLLPLLDASDALAAGKIVVRSEAS